MELRNYGQKCLLQRQVEKQDRQSSMNPYAVGTIKAAYYLL